MNKNNTKKFTQKIADVLFNSQEFWTATNEDPDFNWMPDNMVVVNGDIDNDENFYINVHKITKNEVKQVLETSNKSE